MLQTDESVSFFDKERDRLSGVIISEFEKLLSSTNVLNRKLEEVLGMTREYDTIAELWSAFYGMTLNQQQLSAEELRRCSRSPGAEPKRTG